MKPSIYVKFNKFHTWVDAIDAEIGMTEKNDNWD